MSLLSQFGANFLERVETACHNLRHGKAALLVDDENRENEGDILFAAQDITPESVNFMIRHGTGIICLCLTDKRCEELNLPLMWPNNLNQFETAFTVSIEARTGVTTGVSAKDRAHTIQTAAGESCRPEDLARPGHVFPLRARSGGVFSRLGHTEGSVDLMRIAGMTPAAAICELMNPDGSMARLKDIVKFANFHSLSVLSIEDIVNYRKEMNL